MSAKDDDTTIKRLCWLASQLEIQRDEARAALARVEAVCATAIRVRTERMVEGSLVHIAAKDAIDTFAEAIREAMLDVDAPWLGRLPVRHLEGTTRTLVQGDRLGSTDPATFLEYVEDAPDWVGP